MENQIEKILKQTFNLNELHPIQRDGILATLAQKDCFITMPSGAGKSVCYQLPAVLDKDKGITIVISPYLATIHTEIAYLKSLDIEAETLSGELELEEYIDLLDSLNSNQASDIRILYLTPEKFVLEEDPSQTKIDIKNALRRLHKRKLIARFVIDEASNILLWGNNFRHHFPGLDSIREDFPDVPIMLTTSAAKTKDRTLIATILNIHIAQDDDYSTNLIRPNINCIVERKTQNTIDDIIKQIQQKFKSQSGIIFSSTTEACDAIALMLSNEGIRAVAYHGKLADPVRRHIVMRWIKNEVDVVCATMALGAGITKPDIRFVIHFTMTKSIEEYFLQINLAGRDGQQAYGILYFSDDNFNTFRNLINYDGPNEEIIQTRLQKLTEMKNLCQNTPIDFGAYFK